MDLLHCPYSLLIHLQATLRSLRITLHVQVMQAIYIKDKGVSAV